MNFVMNVEEEVLQAMEQCTMARRHEGVHKFNKPVAVTDQQSPELVRGAMSLEKPTVSKFASAMAKDVRAQCFASHITLPPTSSIQNVICPPPHHIPGND